MSRKTEAALIGLGLVGALVGYTLVDPGALTREERERRAYFNGCLVETPHAEWQARIVRQLCEDRTALHFRGEEPKLD